MRQILILSALSEMSTVLNFTAMQYAIQEGGFRPLSLDISSLVD